MKSSKLAIFVSAALATSVAFAQSPANPPSDRTAVDRTTTYPATTDQTARNLPTDSAFLKQMAIGGITEVDAGKLAAQKAQSKDVKDFGQHMIDDHSKSNDKLAALAKEKNVDLPSKPDAKHEATKEMLEKQSTTNFDAAYMEAMVKAHENTVQLLQNQIRAGQDAKIKQFATETLPTVARHLDTAKQLQAKVGSGAGKPSRL